MFNVKFKLLKRERQNGQRTRWKKTNLIYYHE